MRAHRKAFLFACPTANQVSLNCSDSHQSSSPVSSCDRLAIALLAVFDVQLKIPIFTKFSAVLLTTNLREKYK